MDRLQETQFRHYKKQNGNCHGGKTLSNYKE